MGSLDLGAILDEMGRAIEASTRETEELSKREFSGSAGDGLISAVISGQNIEVHVHPLAKRRLSRDDLGAAVVEAVNAAERESVQALMDAVAERGADPIGGSVLEESFRKSIYEMGRSVF